MPLPPDLEAIAQDLAAALIENSWRDVAGCIGKGQILARQLDHESLTRWQRCGVLYNIAATVGDYQIPAVAQLRIEVMRLNGAQPVGAPRPPRYPA